MLLIFQAMDASGKDGAIKQVMSGVNPQARLLVSAAMIQTLDSLHLKYPDKLKELAATSAALGKKRTSDG